MAVAECLVVVKGAIRGAFERSSEECRGATGTGRGSIGIARLAGAPWKQDSADFTHSPETPPAPQFVGRKNAIGGIQYTCVRAC